jgi:hypothetical protein
MNRTVQFFGQGYGPNPAVIVVKLEDLIVYEGNVPTINQAEFNTAPEDQVLLFTCELPITFDGLKPMTAEVVSGTVVFAQINANHCFHPNGENLYFPIRQGADARLNVKINNVPQVPALTLPGTYSWAVSAGATLSYDLNVAHGTEPY